MESSTIPAPNPRTLADIVMVHAAPDHRARLLILGGFPSARGDDFHAKILKRHDDGPGLDASGVKQRLLAFDPMAPGDELRAVESATTRRWLQVSIWRATGFWFVVVRARRFIQKGDDILLFHGVPKCLMYLFEAGKQYSYRILYRNIRSLLLGTLFALVLISIVLIIALRSVKFGLISTRGDGVRYPGNTGGRSQYGAVRGGGNNDRHRGRRYHSLLEQISEGSPGTKPRATRCGTLCWPSIMDNHGDIDCRLFSSNAISFLFELQHGDYGSPDNRFGSGHGFFLLPPLFMKLDRMAAEHHEIDSCS
uniref:Uncharacterized protein n=1 Tax=Candidatus Kentrum sp. FW TaxID=2126338 RepID=A0A450U3N7_9GAMM|nr:MAG: hypothetical protein BECKFW1821C_GA0114237_11399 [Candidatus Kentron sp. FW]